MHGSGDASVIEKLVEGYLYGRARSYHRIGQDEGLAREVRAGAVFGIDVEIIALVIFAVCGDESALGIAETVQETLVEGETGTEDRRQDDLVIQDRHLRYAKRGSDIFSLVFQAFAYLVTEDFTGTFQVDAEAEPVFLDPYVAHLCDEVVKNRVALTEIDDFHMLSN
jgi:hypothetical protein